MRLRYTTESFAAKVKADTNGKFTLSSEYLGCRVPVVLTCNDCGTHKMIYPYNINRAENGCHECIRISMIRPTVGVDDLWTTRPDVASLLKNPERGYLYRENSKQEEIFQCPICGTSKTYIIAAISACGFSCPNCSDGITYPNKFMAGLLKQMNIDFVAEYKPEWIKPYRYDFFFNINGKEVIVEMDGGIGHGHDNTGYKTKTPQESLEIDGYKTFMANNHNIEVIRIDCNYKARCRFEYISEHIKQSKLGIIFDLSNVDFEKCDKDAQKSLFVETCKLWDSGIHDKQEIAKLLGVSCDTIRNYLIRSEKNGCSSYNHELDYKRSIEDSRKKASFTISTPVICIETKEIFRSITSVRTLTGISVQKAVKDPKYTAGMLADGTKLHWRELTEQEAFDYKSKYNFDSTVSNHQYFKQSKST